MKVLGIDVYDRLLEDAVDDLITTCQNNTHPKPRCISATGAHGLVFSRKSDVFRDTLSNFYRNLPDGVPAVWVARLKGASSVERCYGPSFFEEVLRKTGPTPIKHFLCGGKEGVAEDLKIVCENKFQNHNCVGTFCPPFREMREEEMRSLGQTISDSGADIVWIGLSTPKQETFAMKLSDYTRAKFIVTVGAAFDFHTGKVREAPAWMQRNGLEWFFRLLTEPRRLWKRYAVVVPLFIYYNLKEIVTGTFFDN